MSEEAEIILNQYYQYLRQNPRVSKDRKSVRMLESLIRLSEAHARLYMKSQATTFDAISVIVLMEQTLMSCLFGQEPTPSVIFEDYEDFCRTRDDILSRLELDPARFSERRTGQREVRRRAQTPSPIRRIEDTHSMMFFGGVNTSTQ